MRILAAAALLGALILAGCAAPARWDAGRSLLAGVTPRLPKAPDSLRASLEITALAGGRKSSVAAALSARPGRAYKLDLFGIPGVAAGGFLWLPERWDLVVFDREEYVEGEGDHVDLGPMGIRELRVHDLFSWAWGDFFPGDSALSGWPEGLAAAGNGFDYAGGDGRWRAEFDAATGLPRSATRADSAFRIEYGAWRKGAGSASPDRPVPGRVRLYRYGLPVLEIKVGPAEDDPPWKRDPFTLRIPKGFTRVERLKG